MSIDVMSRVWNQSQTKDSMRVAILALADRSDHNGVSWPGYNDIAKRVNVNRRNAIRIVDRLVETGEVIRIEKRTNDGRRTANRYFVTVGLEISEIEKILHNHDQLQGLDKSTIDQIIADVIRKRGDFKVPGPTSEELVSRFQGGEGVTADTGVAPDTGGCHSRHQGVVSLPTPSSVAPDTRGVSQPTPEPSLEPSLNSSSSFNPKEKNGATRISTHEKQKNPQKGDAVSHMVEFFANTIPAVTPKYKKRLNDNWVNPIKEMLGAVNGDSDQLKRLVILLRKENEWICKNGASPSYYVEQILKLAKENVSSTEIIDHAKYLSPEILAEYH
jgi:DNA-binding Lrp family transcriptional regulator